MCTNRKIGMAVLIGMAAASVWAQGHNRRAERLAVLDAASGSGLQDVYLNWSLSVATNSTFANLGTSFDLLVNGSLIATTTTPATLAPGSGICGAGSCAGSCGNVTIDGLANDLFCVAGECDCRSLPLTTLFNDIDLTPDDEITVILRPAPGALPDSISTDNAATLKFAGPIFWTRQILSADFFPGAGRDPGTLKFVWRAGGMGMAETFPIGTDFAIRVNGVQVYEFHSMMDSFTAGLCVGCPADVCGAGHCPSGSIIQGYCQSLAGDNCGCAAAFPEELALTSVNAGDEVSITLVPSVVSVAALPVDVADWRLRAPCVGDTNGDSTVNLADLGVVLANFGKDVAGYPAGDFNGDHHVDLSDLGIELSAFGKPCH